MKVLHINSYDKKGGAETVFECTRKNYLTENFSACIKLVNSPEKYDLIFDNWEDQNKLLGSLQYVYSFSNRKKLIGFLEQHDIDIIHIHGFFAGLSPSILSAIKKIKRSNKIKVVQTMHDFHMICPNASLYSYSKNRICEKCVGKNLKTSIFLENCDRRGYLHSFFKGIRSLVANNILSHEDCIDCFIAPSYFLKSKLIEDGVEKSKICDLRYPLEITEVESPVQKENKVCYFGRLSKEKDVLFILRAFVEWKNRTINNFKLLIIGSGEEEESIKKFIHSSVFQDDIELKNFLPQSLLNEEIKFSKYFVMASTWYENSPMSILESYALNIIPLVPNLGGMEESIKEIINVGKTYIPGDINSFIDSLNALERNYENELKKIYMDRKNVLNKLSVNSYYKELFKIYSIIVNG